MKAVLVLLFVSFFSGCTAQAVELPVVRSGDDEVRVSDSKTPVLVELFTSEGCSSCPPAEELLSKYDREQPFENVELITLAFHVDYWDGLGWKDKFASALFTQRQQVYDRKFRTGKIYTPQMVVDGSLEFIGSREKDAQKAINKSAVSAKAVIELSIEDNRLDIAISKIPETESATIYLAFAEDGVGSDVRSGENAGKNLRHTSVVRELRGIARIGPADRDFRTSTQLPAGQDWNLDNTRIVVFIQENSTRRINGVSRISMKEPAKL